MNTFLNHYLFCLMTKDGFRLYRIAKNRSDLRYRYGDLFVDHFDHIEEVVYITPSVFAAIDAFKRSEDF